tara:strand:+ start:1166 stop:2185 length:1020 start_codon:yes stop_codon:yes gene_type:complete
MRLKNFIFLLPLITIFWSNISFANEVNIYSHRQPFLINPFLEEFTKKTGIKTNVVYSTKGLAQRLKAEGENSPADVILTVDIGRLYIYEDYNLLQPIKSNVLDANIPMHLKSPENKWFALSKRSRVIVASKTRVEENTIKRIEDLAKPEWKGRICSRPGSHVYNRALMASIIAAHGEEKAEKWAASFVNNLARRPQGNDRAQVKAIFEGQCDIAIINNYYFGKLKYSEDKQQQKWAEAVNLIFPNQEKNDRGAHMNISGGGVAIHSKNKDNAIMLLEFLSEEMSQNLYGKINFEYPVNPSIEPSEELAGWGIPIEDKIPIIKIAELGPLAQKIIDRVGW